MRSPRADGAGGPGRTATRMPASGDHASPGGFGSGFGSGVGVGDDPEDSGFEPGTLTHRGDGPVTAAGLPSRHRRAIALLCAAGLLLLMALVWVLARAPHLNATWRPTPQGQIELVDSDDPALVPHLRQMLTAASAGTLARVALDGSVLHRSARWLIDDADRDRQQSQQAYLARLLEEPVVTLDFADGSVARVTPGARGVTGLSMIFWLLCTSAFGLFLVSGMAIRAGRDARNVTYAVMAGCQAVNMVWIAVEATPELGLPQPFAALDMPLRTALDLATAAAMASAVCLYPRRLPGARGIAACVCGAAALEVALYGTGLLPSAWWWLQASVAACSLLAIGLLSWSYRLEMNPFALVLRRVALLVLTTWALLTAGLATSSGTPAVPANIADLVSMVWAVFLGSLLMLAPFLVRTHAALREFALLAAISTVATSLDLLLVSLGGLSPFAALTLSLFLAMIAYSLARHGLIDPLRGESRLTTGHLFEQLYRAAREAQVRPDRTPLLFARLLGDLFQPLEIRLVERPCARTRVADDGATLLVPTPRLVAVDADHRGGAVLLRFAQRGRRLFSVDDARLTDRIAEQLGRAVHFDAAVEQGRHEERQRLAQDLHDDIGARLLTLMYQAQTPEMGDYLRHTLQDLKTLTRGLAASSHRLSHAAAEWKADLTHRLTAAQVEVHWSFVYDEDILLTVGQWSALTRMLRELVSNTIAHAHAHALTIDFRLHEDQVWLRVTDDGVGVNPAGWSHGLGLGGVRKRVKQLGGTVDWRAAEPRGIRCQVVISALSAQR